jgi:hypothetical protein
MMSSFSEAGRVRPESRERTDLGKQYRPIGIGAVAAALEVVGHGRANAGERRVEPRNDEHRDEYRFLESMAA